MENPIGVFCYICTIGKRQSPQMMFTAFVALTDCPQPGQIDSRALLGLDVGGGVIRNYFF